MQDQAVTVDPGTDPAEPGRDQHRHLGWTPVIGLLAALVAWIRVPSGLRDDLYAEDGVLFVGDWAWRGRPGLFWEPYAGYQHLLPRFGSWLVVTLFPVASWGLAVTAVACVLVGGVAAAVYAFSADLVTFWPARIILGLLVVMVPVAGVEPLGNLANLHWFMLMLVPWALLARPRTRWGIAVVVVAMLVATLTEPICVIFAPLAIWRFVTARRERVVVLAWALGCAAQIGTTFISSRPRTPGRPPWMSLIEGYVRDVGMSLVTANARALGLAINTVGWWTGFAWVLGLVAVVSVAAWFARRDVRVLLATLLIGSVVSWSAAYFANNSPEYYFSLMTDPQLLTTPLLRWATAASAMLASAVVVSVGVLVGRFPRLRPAGWGVLGVVAAVLIVNLPARGVQEFGSWSSQIEEDIVTCRTSGVAMQVYTAPNNWVLGIPCSYADR